MSKSGSYRTFKRRAWLSVLVLSASLMVGYLVLVWAGGGWSARHDARFDWDDGSVLLFAHRGVSGQVPENTEAAFEAARRLGFPGIELDVRKTLDGELAIFHDPVAYTLGLKTRFSDLSLAEIQRHGLFLGTRQTTNTVPTLRTVFSKYRHTFRFYLDMKERGFRDADQLAALLREYGLEERCIVASVDPLFVAYLEHYYPRINTALERCDAAQVWVYRLLPRRWKPDFNSGFARKVTPAHVEWLQKNGLLSQRIVYSVTETNYPDMLRFGIKKAIVDYTPGPYSSALAPPTE